mgnify:CR=1 FL=1
MSLGKRHSIALGAAGSVKWPGGRFFKLIQAAADVTVEFFTADGEPMGEFINVRSGLKFSIEPADIGKGARLTGFGSVKITSATAQTVSAIISRQEIDYDSVAATVSFEKAATNADDADTVIAALGTLNIASNASNRAVVISSDPANAGVALRVSKTGGARGSFLQAGMSVVVDSTDAIKVYNPSAAQTANVGVLYEQD